MPSIPRTRSRPLWLFWLALAAIALALNVQLARDGRGSLGHFLAVFLLVGQIGGPALAVWAVLRWFARGYRRPLLRRIALVPLGSGLLAVSSLGSLVPGAVLGERDVERRRAWCETQLPALRAWCAENGRFPADLAEAGLGPPPEHVEYEGHVGCASFLVIEPKGLVGVVAELDIESGEW